MAAADIQKGGFVPHTLMCMAYYRIFLEPIANKRGSPLWMMGEATVVVVHCFQISCSYVEEQCGGCTVLKKLSFFLWEWQEVKTESEDAG